MFSCLDASIVSTALVSVSAEFANYQDTPWLVLGYLLTYMSFAVGFSKLSDVYGRRNILAIAWLLFTLGSAWCGIARRMGELIAGRAVQGMGGSGLYSLAQVCLLEQGPSRPEVVGALVGVTLSISFLLGPVLGGALAEWNWRAIFWFNLPFGVLAVLGIYILWPAGISQIDFLGHALLAAASILLIFALQEAGAQVWTWVTLLNGFIYISLVIKVPEYLQIVHGDGALWAGVHLVPMLGTCALGSFLGGALSKRTNLTSQTLVAGGLLQAVGLGLVLAFSMVPLPLLLSLLSLYGLGIGLCFASCTMTAAIQSHHRDLAAAQGAVAQARVFGGALGLAVCTIVFQGVLGRHSAVSTSASASAAGEGAASAAGAVPSQWWTTALALPDGSEVRWEAVTRVYLDAFRDQVLVMTCVAVVALVLSLGAYRQARRSGPGPAGPGTGTGTGDVVGVMERHKAFARRAEGGRERVRGNGDVEMSSVSSLRSLVR
ncbi:putative multidrug resistance protein [Dichotomopilus funicola]|uniref:Multidrug resistance protein n=1 Tax=Dichotomopilus funicola TaxID=1934379 RepID=A0AAN6V6F8_9PEZI|nr:putative multidrug resistance protein [Dichotomopilus funicola]